MHAFLALPAGQGPGRVDLLAAAARYAALPVMDSVVLGPSPCVAIFEEPEWEGSGRVASARSDGTLSNTPYARYETRVVSVSLVRG